jgi:hypothetical protein
MGKFKHGGNPVSAIGRLLRLFFEICRMVIFHISSKNTKAVGLKIEIL